MTTSSLYTDAAVISSTGLELQSADFVGYLDWLATLMCQLTATPFLCPLCAVTAAEHRSRMETSQHISCTKQLMKPMLLLSTMQVPTSAQMPISRYLPFCL